MKRRGFSIIGQIERPVWCGYDSFPPIAFVPEPSRSASVEPKESGLGGDVDAITSRCGVRNGGELLFPAKRSGCRVETANDGREWRFGCLVWGSSRSRWWVELYPSDDDESVSDTDDFEFTILFEQLPMGVCPSSSIEL